MTDPKLGFAPFARLRGVLIVFCGENLKFGTATQRALSPSVSSLRCTLKELTVKFRTLTAVCLVGALVIPIGANEHDLPTRRLTA